MEHCTIRNDKLFCLNCGGEFKLTIPIGIDRLTGLIKTFELLHKYCEKTWVEPVIDQSKDTKEKAMWWIANGEIGMSSKTMWNCFMGNENYPIHHPYDPDDFSSCYKLLETVPEWKNELHKLKSLSKEWSNLVVHWDDLTKMYEQNVAQNWKNHKKIGMYEFMQTLIN